MLIDIFETAGLDPSAIVGSLRAKTKSNYRAGNSKYFIVEACEYRRDFLSLTPDVLVITNLEHEHVDYYPDLRAVQEAFREFAHQIRPDGALVINFGAPNIAPVLEGVTARLVDYGTFFNPLENLRVPGLHNQLNAAAAKAAASVVGVRSEVADAALRDFAGTWRRFEYKGEVSGALVYDDYGHHPTEIAATLAGARELHPGRKITLVFQPHTYSRTAALFDDFVAALGRADHVCLLPIYAARETNESGVTHGQLAEALTARQVPARAYETFADVLSDLRPTLSDNDLILVMGAGDVTEVAARLVTP
jgi:UDP-N-acetylmuramate--alanine ligase